MPPREPKSAPRGSKSTPRAAQDRQSDSLWAFLASHETPKTTQETPKSSQEVPKSPEEVPKRSQRGPKRPPRAATNQQISLKSLASKTLSASAASS